MEKKLGLSFFILLVVFLVLGNIFAERFEDIWNGKKFQKIRSLVKSGKYAAKICEECAPKDLLSLGKIADLKRYI